MAHSDPESSFVPPALGNNHSRSSSSRISAELGSDPTPRSFSSDWRVSGASRFSIVGGPRSSPAALLVAS